MENQYIKKLSQSLGLFLLILTVFFALKIYSEIRYGVENDKNVNVISFTGHGEVTAVPDIANISFTISKDASTIKDAQASVALIEKKALDILKAKGVEDKDIKTTDASFYPKYEYRQAVCPQIQENTGNVGTIMKPVYCPSGKQVIIGYTANESITVKVRKTDDASVIIQGLGATGVSNLNGPNFAIDKEEDLKAGARKIAIDDAKAKAKVLAKDLGVRLVKITSFSENGNYPIMYGAAKNMMAVDSYAPTPAQLPKGENLISSDVTITYEIR